MKKLLIVSMLLMGLGVYSQSRTNAVIELKIGEFDSWVSGDEISGWDFDKGEEWKERKGYLRVGDRVGFLDIYEKNDGIKRYKDIIKSYTPQNFNELGIIKVTYKGEEYVGFGIEKVEGRYEYPSIREDWYTFISHYIYIFKNEELLKLKTIDGLLDLEVYMGTYGDTFNKEKKYQSCYDNLKFILENGDREKDVVKFKKTQSEGIEVVRFLLPQTIPNYGKPKFIDFENHYFEVSIEKFNELLSKIN